MFFVALSVVLLLPVPGKSQSPNKNYVRTRTYLDPDQNRYLDRIQYYDGLGRPVQTVDRKVTPLQKDLVHMQEYDLFDRESVAWLPAVSSGDGDYVDPAAVKLGASMLNAYDLNPYSKPVYEPSPLNRLVEQYSPGVAWQNAGKSVKTEYTTNKGSSGPLSCWMYQVMGEERNAYLSKNGAYPDARLYVTRITDEQKNVSYTFTDKEGRVVLSRQINANVQHDTYYVYDAYGNLCYVLPPKFTVLLPIMPQLPDAVSTMQELVYVYKYDYRGNCIASRVPGADWVKRVYDQSDRLILTQDGEQRKRGEWQFSLSDIFGRPTVTGTCTNVLSDTDYYKTFQNSIVRAAWKGGTTDLKGYDCAALLVNRKAVNVNYYDDYSFIGTNGVSAELARDVQPGYGVPFAKRENGRLTGSLTLVFDGTQTPSYLCSALYYDDLGRVVQSKASNLLGGFDKSYLALNFTGRPLKELHVHTGAGNAPASRVEELYTYSYDHAGRQTEVKHKIGTGTEVLLAGNSYDELGRLKQTTRGGTATLPTDYGYTVRSWTNRIGNPLFTEELTYDDNGNIAAQQWTQDGKTRKYAFVYDSLSRLTRAVYSGTNTGSEEYGTSYRYDKHGNPTGIRRYGKTGTGAADYGPTDRLSLTYTGNQLKSVYDSVLSVSNPGTTHFRNNANADAEYAFNANGAMTKDLNKGISDIQYNFLNLPTQIDLKNPQGEARTETVYSADGLKRRVIQKWNANYSSSPVIGSAVDVAALNQTKTTDYVENLMYENGVLKRIQVEGGYYDMSAGKYYYSD